MIQFDDRGLITAVVQHASTGDVLMVAYMNREAFAKTLAGPHVWFYSRSRGELWEKGATSGNYLKFGGLAIDCDGDALLVKAIPEGPACHTGEDSCFHSEIDKETSSKNRSGPGILQLLSELIHDRATSMPEGSYTTELLRQGVTRVAQKVIEEAGETGLAAAAGNSDEIAPEMADLLYHCLVLLESADVSVDEVWRELAKRRR